MSDTDNCALISTYRTVTALPPVTTADRQPASGSKLAAPKTGPFYEAGGRADVLWNPTMKTNDLRR